MKTTRSREIVASVALVAVGAAVIVLFLHLAAGLDPSRARASITEAFQSIALSDDSTRELALVTGFVVADSDQYSTCVPLSLAVGPSADVFGSGPWQGTVDCTALRTALASGASDGLTWFRYWNGNAALLKVMLTVLPYSAVQGLVTLALAALLLLLGWQTWRFSPTFAVGIVIVLGAASDLVWQGMSPGVGLSSLVGLAGACATLAAFRRGWSARWGVAALSGVAYAATAQMHIPMAFAMLVGMAAIVPLLGSNSAPSWRPYAAGGVATVVWVVGYAVGLSTRYAWSILNRGGLESVTGEVGSNSPYFLSESPTQAFYALVSLLMRTWFAYGWLQIGLMLAFAVLGWSLAKGGAQGWRRVEVLLALAPMVAGFAWLAIWGHHTQHLFVNVLVSMLLLNVILATEVARRLVGHEPQVVPELHPVQH